jgi:citrate lyase subunit beta/citryl-CoA lyase
MSSEASTDDVGPLRTPVRSRLYVPGTKVSWIEKAVASGVDAIILDLDDAVEAADKDRARGDVAEALREEWPVPIFVRINEISTRWALDDLETIVQRGLFGVVVPRLTTVEEITSLDFLLTALERRIDIELGSIVLSPILETAASVHFAYQFARASARVDYLGGIATDGGDIEREIGYRWSRSAWESVAMRERCLVELRAAGVANPLTGIWTSLDDPEGLRAFAEQGRDLGYSGMDVIHPSHVEVVHEAFGYSDEAVERAQRILDLASRSGADLDARQVGAIRFEGRMVDAAMVRTAREILRRANRLTS